ncbi:SufD family Fe-S cluster assembly protein [Candidatus Dependentiae bacterium]|nr:SufD family Fe-S cluster assembly protein [Candidatus Dependentiae bacterium]
MDSKISSFLGIQVPTFEKKNKFNFFDSVLFIDKSEEINFSENIDENCLIVLQENAKLNFNFDVNEISDLKINASFKFICKKNSVLNLKINKNYIDDEFFDFSNFYLSMHAGSKANIFCNIKNGITFYKFDFDLKEENAEINFKINYFLNENSKSAIITNQNHCSKKTFSKVCIKKVLDNGSRSYSNNVIHIDRNSSDCNALQSDRCLVLNNACKNLSIPSMQVLNKDISCKHASTTSNVDENQLWYLKCRALSFEKSRQFLIESFLVS